MAITQWKSIPTCFISFIYNRINYSLCSQTLNDNHPSPSYSIHSGAIFKSYSFQFCFTLYNPNPLFTPVLLYPILKKCSNISYVIYGLSFLTSIKNLSVPITSTYNLFLYSSCSNASTALFIKLPNISIILKIGIITLYSFKTT